MPAGDASKLLDHSALERDWDRKEQRIQGRQIKTFSGDLVDRDKHKRATSRVGGPHIASNLPSLGSCQTAVESKHCHCTSIDAVGECVEMVEPVGEHETGSSLLRRVSNVAHDRRIGICQGG